MKLLIESESGSDELNIEATFSEFAEQCKSNLLDYIFTVVKAIYDYNTRKT